jgi:hypothetical protein
MSDASMTNNHGRKVKIIITGQGSRDLEPYERFDPSPRSGVVDAYILEADGPENPSLDNTKEILRAMYHHFKTFGTEAHPVNTVLTQPATKATKKSTEELAQEALQAVSALDERLKKCEEICKKVQ